MTLLSVRNVSVGRGGLRILEGLSFDLLPGQLVRLIGSNGIGKTTLLRTIAGLQPAYAGEIAVDPEQIAFAGHADGVKATLSVAENLSFWSGVHGSGNPQDALDRFELTALGDRAAKDLSAGQRRRLGLARLLVTGRALWLLDEPTVSLDAANVSLFESVLAAHLKAGGAALVSSHLPISGAHENLDLAPFRASFAPEPIL